MGGWLGGRARARAREREEEEEERSCARFVRVYRDDLQFTDLFMYIVHTLIYI